VTLFEGAGTNGGLFEWGGQLGEAFLTRHPQFETLTAKPPYFFVRIGPTLSAGLIFPSLVSLFTSSRVRLINVSVSSYDALSVFKVALFS